MNVEGKEQITKKREGVICTKVFLRKANKQKKKKQKQKKGGNKIQK